MSDESAKELKEKIDNWKFAEINLLRDQEALIEAQKHPEEVERLQQALAQAKEGKLVRDAMKTALEDFRRDHNLAI